MRKGDFDIGDSVAGYDITLLKLNHDEKNDDAVNNKNEANATRVKFVDLLSKQGLNVVIGVSVT